MSASSVSKKFAPHKEQLTALQKHVAFLDLNNDGLITFTETFWGCRKLGFHLFLCFLAPFIINIPLAWVTSDSWWPTATIRVKNIRRARYGSDSQIYDTQGNFNEERFETVWREFDIDGDGFLSFYDLIRMTEQFRQAWDFFGWFASKVKWFLLYMLIQEHGKVAKEFVKGQYDGTLFEKIAEVREKHGLKKKSSACN